ncbi:hypothetical protein [Saccharopolyspora phatthalungensis]|uniref:Transcriptional regulator n=1 Tax=Saccharopolyspora phatthalungensis TaxID=664693 RepID=A0A840QJ10_9PSEU|nr:hypothetical protein [Saccharopolyspora phatthalungensis]MBB5158695.1 hypothetical protein [Saccharopolyspora phatthalungensis]
MRLDLDLSRPPVLRLRAGDTEWHHALTKRHAEIFALLHSADPDGLSAKALSLALFGDAEHLVTVRAEVSRLRRLHGALVDTQPYRLADVVELTVHPAPGRPSEA